MKFIKYFFQFLFIIFILTIFKIIGLRLSRIVASKFFSIIGPFFRSKKIIEKNISFAFSKTSKEFKKNIIDKMWKSYGKILAEYAFIKYFREGEPEKFLEIKGQEILDEIKFSKEPVIFISGHFDNDQTTENITLKLNQLLENMIVRNPHQWIWSHNRWK